MRNATTIAAFAVTTLTLAACSETGGGGTASPGLSNNITPPSGMESMCIDQAARYANVPAGAITVTSRIQTGGGPLLTLNAAGQNLSCRREANGSVTVFSEFAN